MKLTLAALVLAPSASAQILTDFAWIQGGAGPNFAIVHTDIDTATGELSAWGDYQGLMGDLVAVELRRPDGALIGQLGFDGAREGFASGAFTLDPAAAASAVDDGYSVSFLTAAFPSGEMGGGFSFLDVVSGTRILSADQVVGAAGAVGASASMNLTRFHDGRVFFSGATTGLDLPWTGLELRGPAWFGEEGPLVLDLEPFDQSNLAGSFFVELPPGTLDATQLRDLDEGFQYLQITTVQHPGGALRGQTVLDGFMGQNFCFNRANSSAQIGAKLSLHGSPRVTDGALRLGGSAFPGASIVLPLAGRGTGHEFLPGGSQGVLCLGGAPVARLLQDIVQLPPGVTSFQEPIDLGSLPTEADLVPGETLQFQCWYRDVVDGQATSNFSDAIRVRPR